MTDRVRPGEPVLLVAADGERHLVRLDATVQRVRGLGVLDPKQIHDRPWGETLRLGLKDYHITRPRLPDHARLLERRAQIITAKDASRIVYETGLGAGDRVLEAGVGSGALTLALAHAVAPTGRVTALDVRQDHLDVAQRNIHAAELADVVDLRLGDAREPLPEKDLHAVVLDLPDVHHAVAPARDALAHGGAFAAYTPLINQAVLVHQALNEQGFIETRTLELLERRWAIHDRGARPEFDMLGHTGFLTFARKP